MSGDSYDLVVVGYDGGRRSIRIGTPAGENTLAGYIEQASLTTREQAVAYGEAWLANHGSTVDQVSIGVVPNGDADLTPYDGLNKGDALKAPTRAGASEANRVHSLGIARLRRNGEPEWAVTLGTRRQESIIAAERQMSKMGASMGGSFAAATPNVAPSWGSLVSGELPTITLPIADADAMSTTAPYDRTAPARLQEATAITRLQCTCESLVGSTNSVFTLSRVTYVGSTPTVHLLETFIWPGDKRMFQGICNHVFAANEAFQLRITQAGAHNLFSIQPIGSSAI